ncbi:hypothetical protein DBR32_06250 [Taibaiella sp. KBW10]|uniref:hypothetical protein n=1 Tax=Taibaiella sp. KBW10 TaxID=2153357 RepID=UPI000F5A1F49|nr:hypothetical protein [Taibaiella sp. KBW10]RQO31556.1 hypothetical protein DBR32_06250 [Taibaiella sp. KBW10]
MINKNNIVAYINFLYKRKFGQEAPQELLESWKDLNDSEVTIHMNGLYRHWNLDAISSKNYEQEFISQSRTGHAPIIPNPPPVSKIEYPTHSSPQAEQNYSNVPPAPFNAATKTKSSGGAWIFAIVGLLLIGALAYYFVVIDKQNTDVSKDVKTTDTANATKTPEKAPEPIQAAAPAQTEDDRVNAREIQDLLTAEQARNFESIYQHFSPNMERYWDINYPTYDELSARYQRTWDITQNNEHSNIKVDKISDNTYDVSTTYSYYSIKDQKQKRVASKVRFVFDGDHKIIKTYGL